MPDKPEVGFGFGVEGDQSLLATIKALREELKNVQQQQQATASSAEVLHRAWSSLVQLAAAFKLAEFARDVFETAVSIGKLSQITGVSTETLSVYRKAANDVGVAHETVDKGLAKLSRSFIQLQAGNQSAITGFGLLHLKAKDFIGLNSDEKLRKVTDAFATLKDGPEKAAAAIALFGRGGAELIPVLNQLGGEEFAKVREQAERLGIVFSKEMAEGALRAKAALADLTGVAEGVTAQFETGVLPALADAADGIVAFATESDQANKKGENSFKSLGESVGWAIKAIILVLTAAGTTLKDFFLIVGVGLETVGREAINFFNTVGGVITDPLNAFTHLKEGGQEAIKGLTDAWKAGADSVRDSNARFMAEFDKLFMSPPRTLPPARGGAAGDVREKGLGRAEASAVKQQAADEVALHKALTQQELEEDKRAYDLGLMSLKNYFDRRRGAILAGFVEEVKALGAEKLGLQDLLAKATTKKEILSLTEQIAHVDAQMAIATVKKDTELDKNEAERTKAKQDHLLKELEMQKKLADLEGDRPKSAQLANQIEDLQIRHELEQLGRTTAEIDAFLAKFGAARAVRTGTAGAQEGFSSELASFEERKAAIEARGAAGPLAGGISQYQAERELRELYQQEIPLLELKVQKLREQAALAKEGSDLQQKLTREADQEAAKIQKLRLEMAKLTNQWKSEVQSAAGQMSRTITSGFNGWLQGSQKFGQAMKQMWNSIVMTAVQAMENMAAKWIETHIIMAAIAKISKALGFGGDDNDSEKRAAKASGNIQIDAAQASADVFAQAIEQIPFPANLAAAPALAVATEAQVMAFQSQATAGGAAGAAGGAGFVAGGYVARKSFIGGGTVSGPSGTDVIPAWLTAGEHVINREGVKAVGVDTLDMINRGAFRGAFLPPIRQPAPYSAHGLRRYAAGGAVGPSAAPGRPGGASPTVNIDASFSAIDSANFRDHIDDHLDYIADGIKARIRNFRF